MKGGKIIAALHLWENGSAPRGPTGLRARAALLSHTAVAGGDNGLEDGRHVDPDRSGCAARHPAGFSRHDRPEASGSPKARLACKDDAGLQRRLRSNQLSTTSPRYMTMMRLHKSRTTLRSWLTKRSATPASRRNWARSLRTVACTDTSSADVGSSRTRSRGSTAIARAIPTRAFCPPDS